MSQAYYQELWRKTQDSVQKNLSFEDRIKKKEPFHDQNTAKWLIGHLFMNYVQIVNQLDKCFDQMIHPQKREVIGRLLDMALGRLLELKDEIVRIELDNYCFFDNILIELKLTHQDVEIQVPKYFWRERIKSTEHRRKLINQVFELAEREKFREDYLKNFSEEEKEDAWEKHLIQEQLQKIEREKFEEQQRILKGRTKEADSVEKFKKETDKPKTEHELLKSAILLIQRHERARQGRVAATNAKRSMELKVKGNFITKIPSAIAKKAATIIQRHWRRHRRRCRNKKKNESLLQLLGLAKSTYKDNTKISEVKKREEEVRKVQEKHQKEYEEALEVIKKKVTALYSDSMEEDIVDEIRSWFHWYFDVSDYLPDFPPEKPIIPTGDIMGIPKGLTREFIEKIFPQDKNKPGKRIPKNPLAISLAGLSPIGGSALVVAGHWIGPHEFYLCQKEKEKQKKDGKKNKKKEKEQEKKKEDVNQKAKVDVSDIILKESNFEPLLKKADRDYRATWLNLNEDKNYEQGFVSEFIKDDQCCELSLEIRKAVDEFMRVELDILKDALERDKHPKKKRKKKKKPKTPKKKREKKKKQKKDPTGDRTLDDLFMELFKNGIIRDYEEVHLKDYISEKSFCAFDLRERLIDQPPSTGDVRDLLLQLCILPLGSSRIHQLGPLIKSVCLIGSKNSGKEFLARIICTETAAVMFDLSSENVAGKYPGKDGLKMLLHLVEKMSRALQPSVIFIDDTEKTFYKKVPKDQRESDPKRISKIIPKIIKNIKPIDQVLLLGVSSQPWLANKRKFLKAYQKLILIPQMDYGSYVRIWQTALAAYHNIPLDFDVSCLAKASSGFSTKAILDTIKNIFTTEKISESLVTPIKPIQIFDELLKHELVNEDMVAKCLKFYAGTDLPKKKAKRLQQIKEELEKARKRK